MHSNFPRFSHEVTRRIRGSDCTCAPCTKRRAANDVIVLCAMWILIVALYSYLALEVIAP